MSEEHDDNTVVSQRTADVAYVLMLNAIRSSDGVSEESHSKKVMRNYHMDCLRVPVGFLHTENDLSEI